MKRSGLAGLIHAGDGRYCGLHRVPELLESAGLAVLADRGG
jgi:hypothetical protein